MKSHRDAALLLFLVAVVIGRKFLAVVEPGPPPPLPRPRTPTPGSPRDKYDPLGIGKRKAAAQATGDPAEMRRVAQLIREAGYEKEAAELEGAAREAESATSIP